MKENVMKSGFYTTSTDQLSGWTEKKLQSTSQSQTCTKKGHGHWWSAASLIHYSVLNPGETNTGKMLPEDAENAFQEFVESSMYFYATGINTLISHWQKCLYYNGSYFD